MASARKQTRMAGSVLYLLAWAIDRKEVVPAPYKATAPGFKTGGRHAEFRVVIPLALGRDGA